MFRAAVSLITSIVLLAVIFGAAAVEVSDGNLPAKAYRYDVTWADLRSGQAARNVEATLIKRSKLDERVRPPYNQLVYALAGASSRGVLVGPNDWLFVKSRLTSPTSVELQKLPENLKAVGDVVRWFEAQGTFVLIELVPRKHSVYPEELPSGQDPAHLEFFDLVRNGLLGEGLRVPDLRVALSGEFPAGAASRPASGQGEAAASEDLLYMPNDDHWSGLGCYASALALADVIRAAVPADELGPALETHFERVLDKHRVGSGQRMLGFDLESAMSRRFDFEHWRHVAIDANGKPYYGAKKARPILVLGTSFSDKRFGTPSQLIGVLGVDVAAFCRPGFSVGHRMLDIARDIVLGKRKAPRVLVWEFPQETPLLESLYFRQPLLRAFEVLSGPPLHQSPFPAASRSVDRVDLTFDDQGVLGGRSSGASAYIAFDLDEPLLADGSLAVDFGFECFGVGRGSGSLRVEWRRNGQVLGQRSLRMRESRQPHAVMVPIEVMDGGSVDELRIYPHEAPTTFLIRNLGLLER